jgi:hypothetical protein
VKRPAKANLPVEAITNNVLIARGAAAAVFRVDVVSYEFLSVAEKRRLFERFAWWMLKVEADFSIYRVCREYPADHYVDDTVSLIDERFADRARWEGLLADHAEHIRGMRSYVPELYFVVALNARSRLPWRGSKQDSQLMRDAEQEALDLISTYLPARRATTLELQWMMRRAAVRGVCEPDLDPYWSPPALSLDGGIWSAGRADVQKFMASVTKRGRHVEVEGEDGDSVQSFLSLGDFPLRAEFPGDAELLFAPLEKLDFGVDVVAHVRWISNKSMQTKADDSVRDSADSIEDASARYLDSETREHAQRSVQAQAYYSSEPYPPGLDTTISLAVGAADKTQLTERVRRLRRVYRASRLYDAPMLQVALYGDHLLRPDGGQVLEYRKLLKRERLAATMPLGSRSAGSERGIYVAHTIPGVRRPVRFNPLESSSINRGGAVLMVGALGGGKTIAGELLAYQAEHRGSIVVDIDPRPDHSFEALLGDRVHAISLDNVERNRGLLDPLVIAPPALREELAASYMVGILSPAHPPSWRSEVIAAVRAVLVQESPSSRAVVEHLLDSDNQNARDVGRELSIMADWGLCNLAFGDGSAVSTDVQRMVTTIKSAGLSLPPAGSARESYDDAERISVSTLKLIVCLALSLVSGDPSVHKLLLLDEAHSLAETADGRRFLARVLRMTRSMNVTMLLLSQLAGDFTELSELVGQRFSFRQETDEQARANLLMHGLEPTPAWIEMLQGFSDGECLMSGLDRRVAAVKFDVVRPEFLRLADTNPTRRIADLEQAVS